MTEALNFAMDLPAMENEVLAKWEQEGTFVATLQASKDRPQFNFYDGPPFATGLPHYGHMLAATIKDAICRYQTLNGHHVPRINGWDTHGLPIEQLGEKTLGISGPAAIQAMGIDKFNDTCRGLVMDCADAWETIIPRLGRWVDFKGGYKTMDPEFMNATWAVFRRVWDKGLVYRSLAPMPFSTGCGSCLSHFEAKSNYQDTQDPSVVVRFHLDNIYMDDIEWLEPHQKTQQVSFLVWTTTPYSLTGNMALCISPDIEYCLAKDTATQELYILATAAVSTWTSVENPLQVMRTLTADELIGVKYCPPFHYNDVLTEKNNCYGYPVVADSYVKVDAGTGIVHLAPGMGEDDYRVCLREKIINPQRPETIPCYIDDAGKLTIGDFTGMYVKHADKAIIKFLKDTERLFCVRTITHSYPFCYRTDTPLIQKAVSAWFINVHPINDRINQLNRENINWVPESVGDARFANWLKTPHDWSFGRSRFWGTPVPLWTNANYTEVVCVSSARELERLAGLPHGSIVDLHRQFIDSILIPSQKQPGTFLKRIPDVFDCWFESGAMPYGKFAVENRLFGDEVYDMLCGRGEWCEPFSRAFPADFIGEGVDQTRGWFYTLLVLATILFDDTAYRNVIVNGLILSSDPSVNGGRWVKMSKRHKNYASPMDAMNKYGADALRLYMLDSPVTHADPLKFNEPAILDKGKFLAQWYNCFQFLEQEVRMLQTLGIHKDARLDTTAILSAKLNTYDNWILSELYTMTQQVQTAYDGYRLYQVVPLVIRFEELFSKWYINLSKLKMKGPAVRSPTPTSCDAAQERALATLWKVLEVFAVIMSPITPFMSERIYLGLAKLTTANTTLPSVHMVQLAELIPTIKFDALAGSVAANLVDTVMAVRSLKTQAGQSARLKSRMLRIRHRDAGYLRDLQTLETELQTAVKVAEVVYEPIPENETVEYRVVFNKALIGKLVKGRVHEVLAELNTKSVDEFRGLTEIPVCAGGLIIPAICWTLREVTADNQSTEGFLVDTRQSTGAVIMLSRDINMSTEEIIMEDLLKDIQRVKKQNCLKPENIATIYLRSPNPELTAILKQESEYVAERLRSILHCGELPGVDMWETHRLVQSVHVPNKWTYDMYIPGPLPFMDPMDLIRL